MTPLQTGEDYPVQVRCPSCGEVGLVPIKMASRVVMTEGESSRLSIKATAPRLPHICGQLTIDQAMRELEAKT